MERSYIALRRRIASLSFDSYLLTNNELSRIAKIEQALTAAATSDNTETALHTLFAETEERLSREKAMTLSAGIRRKDILFNTYEGLLESISRFLSIEIFQQTMTVWFSRPTEKEYRTLEQAMQSLISESEAAQSDLIELCGSREPQYVSSVCRGEILALKIALALCATYLPSTYSEALDQLSTSAEALEELEDYDGRLRSIGLQIAVELLPPFLESLYPFLGGDTAMLLDATNVRRLFHEVQAFREQLRQTVEPLRKTQSGDKKI